MHGATDGDLNHMGGWSHTTHALGDQGVMEITDENGVPTDSEAHGRKASHGESATFKKTSIAFALGNEL
jgi:hypothetical protein